MGALMVIFSLQPKQRTKTKGRLFDHSSFDKFTSELAAVKLVQHLPPLDKCFGQNSSNLLRFCHFLFPVLALEWRHTHTRTQHATLMFSQRGRTSSCYIFVRPGDGQPHKIRGPGFIRKQWKIMWEEISCWVLDLVVSWEREREWMTLSKWYFTRVLWERARKQNEWGTTWSNRSEWALVCSVSTFSGT